MHEVYKEGNYINARYQAVTKIVSLKRCRTCRSRVKFCCLPLTNYTLETLMTRYTRHKKRRIKRNESVRYWVISQYVLTWRGL